MLEPRGSWRHIRPWLFIVLWGVAVLIIIALLTYAVYATITFGWGWTGFTGGYSQLIEKGSAQDRVYLAPKTLWDWMQLLLVPIMLAIGGFWLNQLQKGREERIEAQRDKTDRDIAADNQREAALQSYIDKIGELLLHERLGDSQSNPQVENVARARTITVLRILDPDRCAHLLRFLRQADILGVCTENNLREIDLHSTNLIQFDLKNFDLSKADLSRANLIGSDLSGSRLLRTDLSRADLGGIDLSEAKLLRADLSQANLTGARLAEANLHKARLCGADLSGADLQKTDLSGADLREANLREARLSETDLSGANLAGARLGWADLSKANLNKADLSKADLGWADLSEAKLTEVKLGKAYLGEANLSGADLSKADLRRAKGLTDVQRADYQSRGALVNSSHLR